MARKKKIFDQGKEVRKLARDRVGIVPASRPIEEKDKKKPKHKKPVNDLSGSEQEP